MFQKLSIVMLSLFFFLLLLPGCSDEGNNPAIPVGKNAAPIFLMEYSDTSVVAGKALSLQLLLKDDDNDTITALPVAIPSGATFDTARAIFFWRPNVSLSVLGAHKAIFLTTDKVDTTFDTITIEVKAGDAPVFTCKPSVKANAGYALSYQLTASDAEKDILKYFRRAIFDTTIKIDSLSGLLRWTPSTALAGQNPLCTLYVTDGLSEDTLVLTIPLSSPSKLQVPSAFVTIQRAIDSAKSGDTIFVDTGTYYENISFKGKMLILASRFFESNDTAMIGKTIIDGQNIATVITIGNGEPAGTRVCGFTITNGRGNGNQGGGIHINKSPVLIDHCTIMDSKSEGG